MGFRSRNRLYYYNGFFMLHDVGNVHWRYLFFPTQFRGKEGYYEGLDAAGKEVGLNKNYDGNDYLRGDAPDYEGEKPESGVANKRVKSTTTMTEIIEKIKQWVLDRNLQTGDPHIQMCKVMEELGELAKAINKKDRDQQIDGLGDVIVTLVCVAEQLGLNIEECCLAAYDEIKDRKGKMSDRSVREGSGPRKNAGERRRISHRWRRSRLPATPRPRLGWRTSSRRPSLTSCNSGAAGFASPSRPRPARRSRPKLAARASCGRRG